VVELPDCTFEKSALGFSSFFFPKPSKMLTELSFSYSPGKNQPLRPYAGDPEHLSCPGSPAVCVFGGLNA
jgi:hypothetical protein